MKTKLTSRKLSGVTLIELTVVIVVLLALVSILFIGAQAWLRGSQKAQCVLLQRNYQQAVRSFQNFAGIQQSAINAGTDFPVTLLQLQETEYVTAPGGVAGTLPPHPGNPTNESTSAGDGIFNYRDLEGNIPETGIPVLQCDSVTDYEVNQDDTPASIQAKAATHQPLNHVDW